MHDIKTSTSKAPVALFAYNRPDHLKKTVKSLVENPESSVTHLIVFCDAAKKPEHQPGVESVRSLAKLIDGFASVTVVEREHNLGLAASIIDGVTQIVNMYGRIIVLEDDLILSKYFLRFMNDALDLYEDDSRVISIHGYVYPVKKLLPETFFITGADCWGWATWSRGWSLFNPNGLHLLEQIESRKLTKKFDFNSSYNYTQMLRYQVNGKNNSWAIRWYASAFLNEKLTLYPGRSLVQNIGNDDSGTHCSSSSIHNVLLSQEPIKVNAIEVAHSNDASILFESFFLSISGGWFKVKFRSIYNYIKDKI